MAEAPAAAPDGSGPPRLTRTSGGRNSDRSRALSQLKYINLLQEARSVTQVKRSPPKRAVSTVKRRLPVIPPSPDQPKGSPSPSRASKKPKLTVSKKKLPAASGTKLSDCESLRALRKTIRPSQKVIESAESLELESCRQSLPGHRRRNSSGVRRSPRRHEAEKEGPDTKEERTEGSEPHQGSPDSCRGEDGQTISAESAAAGLLMLMDAASKGNKAAELRDTGSLASKGLRTPPKPTRTVKSPPLARSEPPKKVRMVAKRSRRRTELVRTLVGSDKVTVVVQPKPKPTPEEIRIAKSFRVTKRARVPPPFIKPIVPYAQSTKPDLPNLPQMNPKLYAQSVKTNDLPELEQVNSTLGEKIKPSYEKFDGLVPITVLKSETPLLHSNTHEKPTSSSTTSTTCSFGGSALPLPTAAETRTSPRIVHINSTPERPTSSNTSSSERSHKASLVTTVDHLRSAKANFTAQTKISGLADKVSSLTHSAGKVIPIGSKTAVSVTPLKKIVKPGVGDLVIVSKKNTEPMVGRVKMTARPTLSPNKATSLDTPSSSELQKACKVVRSDVVSLTKIGPVVSVQQATSAASPPATTPGVSPASAASGSLKRKLVPCATSQPVKKLFVPTTYTECATPSTSGHREISKSRPVSPTGNGDNVIVDEVADSSKTDSIARENACRGTSIAKSIFSQIADIGSQIQAQSATSLFSNQSTTIEKVEKFDRDGVTVNEISLLSTAFGKITRLKIRLAQNLPGLDTESRIPDQHDLSTFNEGSREVLNLNDIDMSSTPHDDLTVDIQVTKVKIEERGNMTPTPEPAVQAKAATMVPVPEPEPEPAIPEHEIKHEVVTPTDDLSLNETETTDDVQNTAGEKESLTIVVEKEDNTIAYDLEDDVTLKESFENLELPVESPIVLPGQEDGADVDGTEEEESRENEKKASRAKKVERAQEAQTAGIAPSTLTELGPDAATKNIFEDIDNAIAVHESKIADADGLDSKELCTLQCIVCGRMFKDAWLLSSHLKRHAGEQPYQCDMCQKVCSSMGNLQIHMRCHTGERPFECDQCSKSFKTKVGLNYHYMSHTGERPFSCEICNKRFTRSGILKEHMKFHNNENKCKICDKSFSSTQSYRDHLLVHTDDMPFSCNHCHRAFKHASNLRKHLRTHQTEYQCATCDKKFPYPEDLEEHGCAVLFKCPHCPELYDNYPEFDRHQRIHRQELGRYECEICGKRSNLLGTHKMHMRVHNNDRPYECDQCDKTFVSASHLQRHRRLHTGEKPYQCHYCKKKFKRHDEMVVHLKQHPGE